jgi:mannose-6-phosphate isomerase
MLYPFRFQPIFRHYPWGGRRLGTVLRKPIEPDENCAESWEIVDHGDDQSVVINGSRAGQTLRELVRELGPRLLGRNWFERVNSADVPDNLRGRFPLLLKFLDARLPLSVQVHPNDAMAARLTPPDLGKTEAWYVLATGPESRIYAGLRPGVDRRTLAEAIAAGSVESALHSFVPQVGDCVFIPAGTVHAIGSDLLICEIQQASDTTYRVFDWNRVDAAGRRRPLHVAEALAAIDFARGPIDPIRPIGRSGSPPELLLHCDKFSLSIIDVHGKHELEKDAGVQILVVLGGEIQLEHPVGSERLSTGQAALIPADLGGGMHPLAGTARALLVRLPA